MSAWRDLSRPIVDGMSVYPGDPLFQASSFADFATDGFHGTKFTLGSHLGSHIDVPFHYFVDGETLDSFPVEFFFGESVILDFTNLVGVNSERFAARETGRPAAIQPDDLAPFQDVVESVPFLFLKTGWSAKFGEPDYYTDFPSLTPDTCDWLDDFGNLRILGLETPSVAAFPQIGETNKAGEDKRRNPFTKEFSDLLPKISPQKRTPPITLASAAERRPLNELELNADAECHRVLLGRRPPILILEGLVSLDSLPCYSEIDLVDGRALVDPCKVLETVCLPLPIAGVDGCPVRAAARVKRPGLKVVG